MFSSNNNNIKRTSTKKISTKKIFLQTNIFLKHFRIRKVSSETLVDCLTVLYPHLTQ